MRPLKAVVGFFTLALLFATDLANAHKLHSHNTKWWKSSTAWTLLTGMNRLRLCSLCEMSAAILAVQLISHGTKKGIEDAAVNAIRLYNTFSSAKVPRYELHNQGDIVANREGEFNMLYRLILSDAPNDNPHYYHHRHLTHEDERRGHGDCAEFGLVMPKDGHIALFLDHSFDSVSVSVLDQNGTALQFAACVDGCDNDSKQGALSTSLRWSYSLFAAFITCLISLIGITTISLSSRIIRKLESIMSAFAAGALIGAVLYHIFPEAVGHVGGEFEGNWKIPTCFISGIFLGVFIEYGVGMVFGGHNHDHIHGVAQSHETSRLELTPKSSIVLIATEEGNTESQRLIQNYKGLFSGLSEVNPMAWTVVLGDIVHNFTDGVLIAAAFQGCNASTGWAFTFAVIVHEVPHEIGNFFILVQAGMSIFQSLFFNFATSLSALCGVVVLLSLGHIKAEILGYILSVGAGMLIFIGMSELLPKILEEKLPGKIVLNILFFTIGVVLMGLTMLFDEHCDVENAGHSH